MDNHHVSCAGCGSSNWTWSRGRRGRYAGKWLCASCGKAGAFGARSMGRKLSRFRALDLRELTAAERLELRRRRARLEAAGLIAPEVRP